MSVSAHLATMMIQPRENLRPLLPMLGLAVVALIAAAPSLTGEFLVGDDRQLLLNHALVNHPTLENVVKLFSLEAQRDLYQPLPLLTFAAEFKLVRWLGLPLSNEGRGAATVLFHGTNVCLHIANVILTYLLIRRASSTALVALLGALLLAVHPLSVESYAWLNGRMTLLSVFFSLLALLFVQRLLERPGYWLIAGAILSTVLAMCSKVRIELPFLMMLLPLIQKTKPRPSWWSVCALALLITAGFGGLNFATTAEEGMFEGAGKIEGSRLARTCITLGWYARSLVWPAGLSPYYPTDDVVNWNHVLIPTSALWVGGAAIVLLVSMKWTRLGVVGLIWFLLSVGPTLPLLPSRNLMAADRYVYFANIGLYWFLGSLVVSLFRVPQVKSIAKRVTSAGLLAALAVCVGLSWRQAGFYENDVSRYGRIAELSPARAGVWDRLGWAYYDAGDYEKAIVISQKELEQGSGERRGIVEQVVGMSLNRMGRIEEAIQRLRNAVEEMPNDVKARARLAKVLADAGRTEDAIAHYSKAVELNSTFNPAIVQLADLLRERGEWDAAAKYYELALQNNVYDAVSAMGLAEIDMAHGAYALAATRLEALLKWMPQNVAARTNLGVCHAQLGRNREAIVQYRLAIEQEPGSPVASANLGLLLIRSNQREAALQAVGSALARFPTDMTVLIGYQDVCSLAGRNREALRAWSGAAEKMPDSRVVAGWRAWSAVLAGVPESAALIEPAEKNSSTPMRLADAFYRMTQRDPQPMIDLIRTWEKAKPGDMLDALDRAMEALANYGAAHADEPWPYYLIAEILVANRDARASGAIDMFEQICTEPECLRRAHELRSRM